LSPTSTAFDRDVSCSSSNEQTDTYESGIRVKKSVTVTFEASPSVATESERRQSTRYPPRCSQGSINQTSSHQSPSASKNSLWQAPVGWCVGEGGHANQTPISAPSHALSSQTAKIAKVLTAVSVPDQSFHLSNPITRHFQRMTKRIRAAKPSVILDQLEEEWDGAGDQTMGEDLQIEKLICAIIALENESSGGFVGNSERTHFGGAKDHRSTTNLLFHANIGQFGQTCERIH
jgi:hypothetical protein